MTSSKTLSLFQNLPVPGDYYQGRGQQTFPLPRNILFFYRRGFEIDQLRLDTNFHYRHVLIFNRGSRVRMMVDGSMQTLHSNEFTLVLPFQYHRFLDDGQKELSLLFTTFEMMEDLPLRPLRNLILPFDESQFRLLGRALVLFNENRERELPLTLALLLAGLTGGIEDTRDEREFPLREQSALVSTVCSRLYKDRSLTVKDLSTELGYSEAYLRRSFRRDMGISLGRYILESRLTEAARYLSTTDLSVTEIADRAGYENISSLSRSFRNHLGSAPLEYRKNHRLK